MPDFPVSESFIQTANPRQLHDEARGNLIKWPASFTLVDGEWVYRVERDDLDDAAEARVDAAIANHVANPDYGLTTEFRRLRELAAKTTLTDAERLEAIRLILKRLAVT